MFGLVFLSASASTTDLVTWKFQTNTQHSPLHHIQQAHLPAPLMPPQPKTKHGTKELCNPEDGRCSLQSYLICKINVIQYFHTACICLTMADIYYTAPTLL